MRESRKQRNGDNGGVVSYTKGDFIGTFTGKIVNGFYELDFVVRYKFGLFKWGVKNTSFTGYLLPNQITTISQASVDDDKKKQEEEDYKKQLAAALGTDNEGKTTASSGTATTKNNTMLYVLGGLALLLGGAWLYMNRKKKPAVATALPVVQPLKK